MAQVRVFTRAAQRARITEWRMQLVIANAAQSKEGCEKLMDLLKEG